MNPPGQRTPEVRLAERERETVDQLIARVLRLAHGTAEALDNPHDARVILHLTQAFADELATTDPLFNRLRFIEDVMDDPS